MLITIYDSVGNPKVDLSPNDSSTQVKEVQGDSVLTLSFTHYEHIELDVDDYADFQGERFWLTEKYRPRQNSKKEWVYDLKLYGVESMIKRLLVIKTVDNEDDPVFTLTAPPREHVAMIVKCMNDGMGNITDWKVGQVAGTENIIIDYFGKYCDEALREIAEKVGAEWWVDGQTINVCKCEHGEPVRLGYGKGLLSIDPATADNVKFYTRLYPVGSSRNIDREKYGFTRLQLPGGQKYVEINADKYGRVDHFEQSAFEGIYPRRTGTVSSVRSEVKTGEDGKPFTIYYFMDDSLPFDPNDYMIGGLVIRVSFQEGSELAGLGEEENGTYFFEVNFDSATREFEIITIWPYDNDIQLPGDKLVPKAGDKYILWNLGMPEEYYRMAEEEFLEAAERYNAEHGLDISVYKGPTDHVWIEENGVDLTIGRRIRLESDEYFPEKGYCDSRITKITRKVNLPTSMDIEISDALSRTAQEKITDSISEAMGYARSIGESVSLPDIIRTGDRTKPTDNNLLSAARTYNDLLRKDRDDRTEHGLTAGTLTSEGAAHAKGGLSVGNFTSGLTGAGVDAAGNAEVESLTARSFLKVYELIYNRLNALEGDTSFADSGTIETVEVGADGSLTAVMRKRWDGDFTAFQPGDIVYGYVNDLGNAQGATYGKAWARVASVDRTANTLVLVPYADSAVPSGTNLPLTAEMLVTRWGNAIDPNTGAAQTNPDYSSFIKKIGDRWVNTRQQSFFVSCEMGNIVELMGVDAPILRQGNYGTVLGQLPDGLLNEDTARLVNPGQPYLYARGAVVQDLIHIDYAGARIRTPNFRGAWSGTDAQSERGYRMADDSVDIVSHGGGTWQCCAPKAGPNPPSDGNPDWVRISGTDFAVWEIVPSVNVIYIRDNAWSTNLLECRVRRNNGSDTEEYTASEALDATGMELVFSMDGITYQEYWTRTGDTIELEDGDPIELESGGGSLDIGGNNVPWSEVVDHIWLRLRDKATKKEAVSFVVPVVRDGAPGKDGQAQQGKPGKDGVNGKGVENRYRVIDDTADAPALTEAEKSEREPSGWSVMPGEVGARKAVWMITATIKGDDTLDGTWSDPIRLTGTDGAAGAGGQTGPIAYPCGVFDRLRTYRATAESVPVVQDGKDSQGTAQYYALNPGKEFFAGNGTAEFPGDPGLVYRMPHEDAANNGGYWRRMDGFSMVFADILMARFAKISSAVFWDEYMMSQQGMDGSGVYSDRYEEFPQSFNPNLLLDFKKGKLTARNVEFYGTARQLTTLVTDDNYTSYLFENHNYTDYAVLDWRKTGGNVDINVNSKHIILFLPSFSISVTYDHIEGGLITLSVSDLDEVRRYAGATAVVRNVNPSSGTRVPPTVKVMGVVEAVGVDIHTIEDGGADLNCGRGVCFQSYLGTREYRAQDDTAVNSGNLTEELVWRMCNEFEIRGFNNGTVQQS